METMLTVVGVVALLAAIVGAFWLIATTWGRPKGPLWVIGFILLPPVMQLVYVVVHRADPRVRKAAVLLFGSLILLMIVGLLAPTELA